MFKKKKEMQEQLEKQQKKIESLEKVLERKEPRMSEIDKEILDELREEKLRIKAEESKKEIESLRKKFLKENKKVKFDPTKSDYLYNAGRNEWRRGIVLDYEVKALSFSELYFRGGTTYDVLRKQLEQDKDTDKTFEIHVSIHLLLKIDEYQYQKHYVSFTQEEFDRYVMDVSKVKDKL